jgi:hypothetical protein
LTFAPKKSTDLLRALFARKDVATTPAIENWKDHLLHGTLLGKTAKMSRVSFFPKMGKELKLDSYGGAVPGGYMMRSKFCGTSLSKSSFCGGFHPTKSGKGAAFDRSSV